jgi:Fe-S cluster biogenesis protein NfuA/nitrite reductase/ring-hydroxylating ferredoxin subunit
VATPLAPGRETTPQSADLRASGERIDALLNAAAASGRVAAERAEELVRLVTDLYGAGLERFMDILYEGGHLDERLIAELAGDELIGSLLLVHGLHPYDLATRVEQALESVRPYLGTHGGDVELVSVTDGQMVHLRLLGSCHGCPSSSVTLKLAVEGAIEAAAPEVTVIHVETDRQPAEVPGPLISVESLRSRLHSDTTPFGDAVGHGGASWVPVPAFDGLADGGVTTGRAGSVPLLACRIAADLFAFRDRCPRCESSLAGAVLARRMGGAAGDAVLRCPSCRAHFDVRRAGACIDHEGLHLDPLPLLVNSTSVVVAVPTPVVA